MKRPIAMIGSAILAVASILPATALAHDEGHGNAYGFQLRAGGRYDNVRLCVATGSGVRGGPAGDVAFFADLGLTDRHSLTLTLPVFRPIMFAASFQMLQFEPQVTLNRRYARVGRLDPIVGATLGLSFHYGPSFRGEKSGANRIDFFAMGPIFGAYFGLDFDRPDRTFNFQLGISPYVTPLFSPSPDGRNGVVVGAMLDAFFRFSP